MSPTTGPNRNSAGNSARIPAPARTTQRESPRLALPELKRRERVSLWLSYQRYGLLMAGASLIVLFLAPVFSLWLWPTSWLLWLVTMMVCAAVALKLMGFAVYILGRWPQKLRATIIAQYRINTGRFSPDSLQNYCGDPCFRLVADEILQRAAIPADERQRLIGELRTRHERASQTLLFVDRERDTVFVADFAADELGISHDRLYQNQLK